MNREALSTISRAQQQALSKTAQELLNEARREQVMPFDSGSTQNEDTYVDDSKLNKGKATIVTDNPYARRLYFHPEFNFKTAKNMNARGEWWEEWLTGGKSERAKKLFGKFLRQSAGGYVH